MALDSHGEILQAFVEPVSLLDAIEKKDSRAATEKESHRGERP